MWYNLYMHMVLNDLFFFLETITSICFLYLPTNLHFCIILFILYVQTCSLSIYLAHSHDESVFHVNGGKIW